MTATRSLVIGDSSAIGQAIVQALLARGDTVVGVSRHPLAGPAPAGYTRLAQDLLGEPPLAAWMAQAAGPAGFHHLVYAAGFHRLQPLSPLSDGSLRQHPAVERQQGQFAVKKGRAGRRGGGGGRAERATDRFCGSAH